MTVSVIIPTWNRAHTLLRAIRSVLAQTVPVLEILVCDDGSTDNSQELIHSLGAERVIWIGGPHSGLPAVARNRGLAVARGEWVAFLDSDDEWLPDKLKIQLSTQLQAKAVCSNAFRVLPVERTQPLPFLSQKSNKLLSLDELLTTNGVICSSSLIHCSILKRTGGFPEDPSLKAIEDYALWLRVACLTPILYLSQPLVRYYDNPQQSVRQDDVPPLEQRIRILQATFHWANRHRWVLIGSKARQKIQRALNTALGLPTRSIPRSLKLLLGTILNR